MSDRVTTPARIADQDQPPANRWLGILLNILILACLLYVFLFSIALFGAAFKLAGKEFSEQLIATTTNPVVGLMIGLLATSLIQSSSSSTSIIVGMVAGGVLTVQGAIPIIMGANMGTTVTNTLVAMTSINRRTEFQRAFAGATMHDFFNLIAIMLLFPIEQATHFLERSAGWLSLQLVGAEGTKFPNPIKAVVKPVVKEVQHFFTDNLELTNTIATIVMVVVALAGIFFALTFLTKVLKRLVLDKAEGSVSDALNGSGLAAMAMGLLVTVGVQSSSITTSLLVPLIGAGIVPLEAAFSATMGANIGTTVTALLASMTGSPQAVTVAIVHLLFNISGILIIYPIPAIRRIPIRLAKGLAKRTAEKRIYALYYMIGVFFVMPLLFIFIDKMLRA
ncbi:MAG: sodium-dependent phosphate cotransporter [Candidatus Krumholzibacteriia bacterium]|jgi:sodium-dependent phosphate cotransporter